MSKMNYPTLAASFILLLAIAQANATLSQRLLKRQSSGESTETESTTPSSSSPTRDASKQPDQNARLYPDLPRPPSVPFVPPFGTHNNNQPPVSHHHGQVPFSPAGMQMPGPNNRLQGLPFDRPPQPPRHMSPLERLQSQTFTSGLGKRLLSMIGINSSAGNQTTAMTNETTPTAEMPHSQATHNSMDETMRALQNSTVLRQLNSGVHSIYGSLSRIYNSTVQQQLDLLQERYRKEAANSTDPWQQRMAQQVPQFFRNMAMKVNEAQENLNRVWRQVAQAGNSTTATSGSTVNARASNPLDASTLSSTANAPIFDGNGFLSHLGRSFGFGPDLLDDDMQGSQQRPGDMVTKLMDFWHNQVQPQMGIVRGQVMRIWRDLTSSGALRPPGAMGGRGRADMSPSNGSTDVVDDVLKDVELDGPEYKLIDPRVGNEPGQQGAGVTPIMPQFQNGVVNMQRELNQLWSGLTSSIQNALNTVSQAAKRRKGMTPSEGETIPEMDPAENEISDKLKDLSKVQRDADVVYDTVQRQQQQAQQRASFGDRFMNFFNSMDLGNNMDQLGNRVGESISRFGNMIGDIWNH